MWGERRPGRARRGQNLVELALMMPVLALLLIGTLDLGRVFFYQTRLTNAILEGAFYGGHYPANTATVIALAYAAPQAQLGVTGTDFVIDAATATGVRCYVGMTTTLIATIPPGDCAARDSNTNLIVRPGDSLEIVGRYRFQPITSQLLRFLPANYTIRKSVRMVIQ